MIQIIDSFIKQKALNLINSGLQEILTQTKIHL